MKFLGHWRIFFFRFAKREKKCLEEHIKESLFSERKDLLNFQDSAQTLHFTLAEKFARVVKTVAYVVLKDFEEKNMFETLHIVSKFLGIWDKKIRALFRKVFSELSEMPSARPLESFAENQFFYQRNYVSCLKFGSAAIFFVPWQIGYLGEPNQQCTCLEETFVGTLLSKTVFFSIVRTLSRETWTFYGKIMARLPKL